MCASTVGGGLLRTSLKYSAQRAPYSFSLVSSLHCVLNEDFTPAAIFSAHHLGDFVHLALLSSVGCIFCLASKFIRICSFISSCHSLNSSVSLCTGAYNAPVTCLTWCLVISSSEYVDSRWLLTLPVLSTSSSLLPFSCLAALYVYG